MFTSDHHRLQHLRSVSPHLEACKAVTRLFHEFLNMSLHVDLDIVTRFAGKCGEEEAHRAYQVLQAWRGTKQGRTALWHAAQVVKAARVTRPYELRGPETFLTYHSIMVLWAYSMMYIDSAKHSRSTTPLPGQRYTAIQRTKDDSSEQPVYLDDGTSEMTEAYILTGSGRPCLRMQKRSEQGATAQDNARSETCDLRNPPMVMQMGVQVLRANCPRDRPENMPQMLRSLCDVMDGLARLR